MGSDLEFTILLLMPFDHPLKRQIKHSDLAVGTQALPGVSPPPTPPPTPQVPLMFQAQGE